MRLLFCAFLLIAAATAQVTGTNATSYLVQKYLVEYTTTEKCRDCSFSYAMVCTEGNIDCNTPRTEVPHTKDFSTIKDALTFINAGMVERIGDSYSWRTIWPSRDGSATFVRLIAFNEVRLDKDVRVTEQVQPAKKTEQVTWRYGNEIGEVYPSRAISITATTGTELLSASSASTVGWITEANPAFVSAKPGDCFRINSTGNGELIACPKEVVPVRHAQPRADKPRSAR